MNIQKRKIDGRIVGVRTTFYEYDSVFSTNFYRTDIYLGDGFWRSVSSGYAPTKLGSVRVALRNARKRLWEPI